MDYFNITSVPASVLKNALHDDFKKYPYIGFAFDSLRNGFWEICPVKSRSPADIFFYSRQEIEDELGVSK